MRESIQITEANAFHFLQAVEEGILDGYFVDESIESYPLITTYPLQVRMFKGDSPETRFELKDDIDFAFVSDYNPIVFLLNFQSAVLQGFHVVDEGTNIDPVGLQMAAVKRNTRVREVVLDIAPNASDELTEAPVAEPKPATKPATKRKPK